jgi:hypothetical protein
VHYDEVKTIPSFTRNASKQSCLYHHEAIRERERERDEEPIRLSKPNAAAVTFHSLHGVMNASSKLYLSAYPKI